jgi:hypothetical protein
MAAPASATAAACGWSSVANMTTIKVYTNSTGVDTYDDAAYNVNNANAVLTVTDHKAHQIVTYSPAGWLRIEGSAGEMPEDEREDF